LFVLITHSLSNYFLSFLRLRILAICESKC
jgi:hypothetical protein